MNRTPMMDFDAYFQDDGSRSLRFGSGTLFWLYSSVKVGNITVSSKTR